MVISDGNNDENKLKRHLRFPLMGNLIIFPNRIMLLFSPIQCVTEATLTWFTDTRAVCATVP